MCTHDDGTHAPAAREERSSFLPEPRRLEGFSDAAFSIIITAWFWRSTDHTWWKDTWRRNS